MSIPLPVSVKENRSAKGLNVQREIENISSTELPETESGP